MENPASKAITQQPMADKSFAKTPTTETGSSRNNSSNSLTATSTEGMKVEVPDNAGAAVLDLFTAVRYGQHTVAKTLLEAFKGIVNDYDSQGYTCAHWAAKKGDMDMMGVLRDFGANFCLPTLNESKMLPIHWAASDGKIESMKFIISHYPRFEAVNENTPSKTVTTKSLDAQDSNGYTPVMIATQYNHAVAVIFLIKAGCDMTVVDVNGDVALHWAAYKGHIELVGLLTYYTPLAVEQYDLFGQTPLHLASLRGNTDVVEYLMHHCHADVLKKDKNGQLPLDIAVKKQHFRTEWMIRRYMYTGNFTGLVRSLGGVVQLMRNPRALNAICMGTQEKDMMVWPWRIVAASNLCGTLTTLYFCTEVALLDFYWFHLIGCIIWMLWWFFFLGCLFVSPGVCVDNMDHKTNADSDLESEQKAFLLQNRETDPEAPVGSGVPNRSFDEALNLICQAADTPGGDRGVAVCYTCKLRKPLRSKHCKIAGKCIQKFDHFCPFVGNTVGRDNYKFFIGLLTVHFFGAVMWEITAIYLTYRVRVSWMFVIFMVYSLMWLFMIMGLGSYHLQLVFNNMTTNEHINAHRYPHFKDNRGSFHNPFDRSTFMHNLLDALFPSKVNLYTREEALEKLR